MLGPCNDLKTSARRIARGGLNFATHTPGGRYVVGCGFWTHPPQHVLENQPIIPMLEDNCQPCSPKLVWRVLISAQVRRAGLIEVWGATGIPTYKVNGFRNWTNRE